MSRREWMGAVCEGERSKAAIRSWFKLIVTDDWEGPFKADVQSDIETDRTTAIRALFRTPGGQLREAYRRFGVRTSTFGTRPPTPAILKDFRLPPAENSPSDDREDGQGEGR